VVRSSGLQAVDDEIVGVILLLLPLLLPIALLLLFPHCVNMNESL
jgi:hypothetical protein